MSAVENEPSVEVEQAVEPEPGGEEAFQAEFERVAQDMGVMEKPPEPEPAWDKEAAMRDLDRLREESGQAAWQAQHELERSRAAVDQLSTQAELESLRQERDDLLNAEILGGTMEELQEALDDGDEGRVFQIADDVAASKPELLPDVLESWSEVDPFQARHFEATHQLRVQAEQEQEAQRQQAVAYLEAEIRGFQAQRAEAEEWQQGTQAAGDAIAAEVGRLRKLDPRFGDATFAANVHDFAQETAARQFQESGALSPEAAPLLVRSSYESAVALREAEEDARVSLPFDEAAWVRRQADDRTGSIPPWDREEALQRLTGERLRIRELGTITREREKAIARRGDHIRNYRGGDPEFDQAFARAWEEKFPAAGGSAAADETDAMYARNKAANDEIEARTGRRPR